VYFSTKEMAAMTKWMMPCGWAVGVVLWAALPAMCQKADSKRPGEKPREEPFGLNQNPSYVLKVVQEVRKAIEKEIKLDDEDEEAVDDVFDDVVKQVNEETRLRMQEEKRNAAKIKEIKDKMQKAREDRDWEGFRKHREEYQKLTGGSMDLNEVLDGLQESLKDELSDKHHPALEKIISRFRQEHEPSMEGVMRITAMFQAMKEVKPEADQKEEWNKLLADLTKELKDLHKADEEAQFKKADEFRDRALKILDEDQIAAFKKAEEKAMAAMSARPDDPSSKRGAMPAGKAKPASSKGSEDDESDEEHDDGESGDD